MTITLGDLLQIHKILRESKNVLELDNDSTNKMNGLLERIGLYIDAQECEGKEEVVLSINDLISSANIIQLIHNQNGFSDNEIEINTELYDKIINFVDPYLPEKNNKLETIHENRNTGNIELKKKIIEKIQTKLNNP